MSRRSTQKIIFAGWCLGMIAVFSVVIFLHWKIGVLADGVRDAREIVYRAEEKYRKSRITESQATELAEGVQLFRAGLADRENPLPLVRSLEDMKNILPVSVEVTDVRDDSGMYYMQVVVEGEYKAVYDSLRLLETSPSLLVVDSVVFEQITAEGTWRARAQVRVPVSYGDA